MKYWKNLRGYAGSVALMCIGIALVQLLLHHRMPSRVLLFGSVSAGIMIEAIGDYSNQIRNLMSRKRKHR